MSDLNVKPRGMNSRIGRREALYVGAAFVATIAAGQFEHSAQAQTAKQPDAFLGLSKFLTGSGDLDKALATRYQLALIGKHPGFSDATSALDAAIKSSGAKTMDDWLATTPEKSLRDTATVIVSAWYLGVVSNDKSSELIAFSQALMYRPTRGALVIPTYASGPLAWGPKPVVSAGGEI